MSCNEEMDSDTNQKERYRLGKLRRTLSIEEKDRSQNRNNVTASKQDLFPLKTCCHCWGGKPPQGCHMAQMMLLGWAQICFPCAVLLQCNILSSNNVLLRYFVWYTPRRSSSLLGIPFTYKCFIWSTFMRKMSTVLNWMDWFCTNNYDAVVT